VIPEFGTYSRRLGVRTERKKKKDSPYHKDPEEISEISESSEVVDDVAFTKFATKHNRQTRPGRGRPMMELSV
jgi:hypothetical protein